MVRRFIAPLMIVGFCSFVFAVRAHGNPTPIRVTAANDVKIVVQGVEETAIPWEVRSTRIRILTSRPVPGGVEITIPQCDQTAIILVTSNVKLIGEVRQKIQSSQLTDDMAKELKGLYRSNQMKLKATRVTSQDANLRLPEVHVTIDSKK